MIYGKIHMIWTGCLLKSTLFVIIKQIFIIFSKLKWFSLCNCQWVNYSPNIFTKRHCIDQNANNFYFAECCNLYMDWIDKKVFNVDIWLNNLYFDPNSYSKVELSMNQLAQKINWSWHRFRTLTRTRSSMLRKFDCH